MRRITMAVLGCAGGLSAAVWMVAPRDRLTACRLPSATATPAASSDVSRDAPPAATPARSTPRLSTSPDRDWTTVIKRVARKRQQYARSGPKPFDEPQGAADFFFAQRLAAGMTQYPVERLQLALDGIRAREALAAAARGPSGPVLSWTELGPANIGGRTRSLLIHPTSPNTLFAAGVAGGVWRSTDAGASWAPTDDLMLNLAVCSLAMDPTDPDVLYAGTGEGFLNGDAVRGLGVFKSVDGGSTWAQLPATTGPEFYRVNDLAISPFNPQHVYACTRYGVYKSVDAGTNWNIQIQNTVFSSLPGVANSNGSTSGCMEIALRSDTPPGSDVILAAFGSFDTDGLFRSANGGVSWTQVGTTSDLIVNKQGRMALAFAPTNNNIVYLSLASNGIGGPAGTLVNLFRSTDGGLTWFPRLVSPHPINPYLLSNLTFSNGCFSAALRSQGWYDNVVAVDPLNENIVWVGGIDLFRSDDGGQHFGLASYWFFDPDDPNYVHADHHALAFHPDYDGVTNQTLYSGSDGGIARTDNARAAVSSNDCPPTSGQPLPAVQWTQLNNGYGTVQFYHGDAANLEDTFAGGTQDNGTVLTNTDDDPGQWRIAFGGDGGYVAIDHSDNQIMYGENQRFPAMQKSVDGGFTWQSATNGIFDIDGLFITPFAMDPNDPLVLWTGGQRPWRTTDGAANWALAGNDFVEAGVISAIAIAPSNSNTVYLGFNSGHIAMTHNGLDFAPVWNVFGSTNGLITGTSFVSSIAVHPTNPNIVYATYSTFDMPHVYRSLNGGTTWTSIDVDLNFTGVPDMPVHWIAIRPCDPDQLFVGTELGVFVSSDAGVNWDPANDGLAHTVVETLDFTDDYHLVAFTHGRGSFRAELECPCNVGAVTDCNNNSTADECDIAFETSSDCNGNGVPDECDVVGGVGDCDGNLIPDVCEDDCNNNGVVDACDTDPSDPDGNGGSSPDCNANDIPDECEPDCNDNNIPDACDIDPLDPDGNGSGSADCNANGFPDECDIAGGGVVLSVGFESGLPPGWTSQFPFVITNSCASGIPCDGVRWAYSGSVLLGCKYGDNETSRLISPPIALPETNAELRFCHNLVSEEGFDFADVFVNDVLVFRDSGHGPGWTEEVIDLAPFGGQTVTLTWRFTTDANISGLLGWQVDAIQVIAGSSDCNNDDIPDDCNPDENENGVADACEAVCCLGGGVCNASSLGAASSCFLQGGAHITGVVCEADCQPNGLPDACETVETGLDCNADFVPDECQLTGNDCNTNGVPDDCDPDQDNDGVPNDCETPAPLPATGYPHGAAKNRYISFVADPTLLGVPHGYRVTEMVAGRTWFVSTPRAAAPAGVSLCFLVSDATPLLADHAAYSVVYVGGCDIVPGDAALAPAGRRYEVRTTWDAVTFSQPLSVYTVPRPTNARWWSDVSGFYSPGGNPSTIPPTPPFGWLPPDGMTTGFDINAVIQGFGGSPTAAFVLWTDIGPEIADRVTNGGDILQVVNAFSTGTGREFYPFAVPDPPGDQGQAGCTTPPLSSALLP